MKAFAIDEFGQPGSLHELPDPEAAEGQVRVRVAAAGLNPFDNAVVQGYLKDRMEHRFPLVPGMDDSGTVDAVGSGVSDWSVGDEVFGSVGKGCLGEGTLAELTTMSAGTIARKPSSLDHATSAAIPTAGVTALNMADALAIEEGQTVVAIGPPVGSGATSSSSRTSEELESSRCAAARTPTTRVASVRPTSSTTRPGTSRKRSVPGIRTGSTPSPPCTATRRA